VSAIRVMLGNMPAMLYAILEETFAGQRDIMVVRPSDSSSSLSASVSSERPDVLVVGVDRPEWVSSFAQLFVDNPMLRVLAIGEDARSATMHELYLRRWRVADPSPRAIVDAVYALHAAPAAYDAAPPEGRR
jgi:hypothetical protein